MIRVLFWFLAGIVVYTYAGYALIITLLAKVIKRPTKRDSLSRTVTLLIAAYNEEKVIEAKIQNSLDLDYPKDKLEIIIVTDGSTDRTPELVGRYAGQGVKGFHSPLRNGKMAAITRVLPQTSGEIIVFSDANTFFNREALRVMVEPFADAGVGCVAGEKRVVKPATEGRTASSEGLYWHYESFLKKKDSQVYTATGAAGEIYAVRRNLLELPPANALLDDFMVSMLIAKKGKRIIYEPRAQATELEGSSLREDWVRRVRISCGGFQSIWWLRDLLNPKYGILWFQFVSHRVLRWAAAPLALVGLVLVNFILLKRPFYRFTLAMQAAFYFLAGAGIFAASRGRNVKGLAVPGYFVTMNLAALAGLYRYLTRSQSVNWTKAERNSFYQSDASRVKDDIGSRPKAS